MLNNGTGFKKVYIATSFTDLGKGIDGLAKIIRFQFNLGPYDKTPCSCSVSNELTVSVV